MVLSFFWRTCLTQRDVWKVHCAITKAVPRLFPCLGPVPLCTCTTPPLSVTHRGPRDVSRPGHREWCCSEPRGAHVFVNMYFQVIIIFLRREENITHATTNVSEETVTCKGEDVSVPPLPSRGGQHQGSLFWSHPHRCTSPVWNARLVRGPGWLFKNSPMNELSSSSPPPPPPPSSF